MNSAMEISASALTAQRLRMEIAAHNMANSQTVGYKRRSVELAENRLPSFEELLQGKAGGGVTVAGIQETEAPFTLRFDPSNPEADEKGYIKIPQTDPITDMVELMTSMRAYEANLAAVEASRSMSQQALSIGK
jgi:flagellar basal-body rod protein FlgC